MKQIKIAASDLKTAIIAYFSDPVEVKVKRITVIMLPLIVIGSYIAWFVNNHR